MFRRMRREARPSVLFLGEFVALHHRPHCAIEQDDALAEEGFERMNGCGVHGEAAINDKVPDSATNKLTYHDASMRPFFQSARAHVRNRSPERASAARAPGKLLAQLLKSGRAERSPHNCLPCGRGRF